MFQIPFFSGSWQATCNDDLNDPGIIRMIVESLLGLRLEKDKLNVAPCLPADWKAFKVQYRYRETVYHIEVLQTPAGNGEMRVSVDGIEQHAKTIPLGDDHKEHWAEVRMP